MLGSRASSATCHVWDCTCAGLAAPSQIQESASGSHEWSHQGVPGCEAVTDRSGLLRVHRVAWCWCSECGIKHPSRCCRMRNQRRLRRNTMDRWDATPGLLNEHRRIPRVHRQHELHDDRRQRPGITSQVSTATCWRHSAMPVAGARSARVRSATSEGLGLRNEPDGTENACMICSIARQSKIT